MKLVFIHGPAASGKLTVARELAGRIGASVFHNHLIVDAVASVFPFGSERFVKLRERFWLMMFQEAVEADRSLIFTYAPEPTVAPDFPDRVRQLVKDAGGDLLFVRLTVPVDEQERRLGNASRAEFGKLRSLELLRQLSAQFAACEAAMPAADITIDTGLTEPAVAAGLIARELERDGWRRDR